MKSIHKYLFLIGVVLGCKNVFFSMDCKIDSEILFNKLTIPADFNSESVFKQLDLNCKQQYRTHDQTSTQPLVEIKKQRSSSGDSQDNLFDKTTQASTAKETYEESYNGSDDTKKFLKNIELLYNEKAIDQEESLYQNKIKIKGDQNEQKYQRKEYEYIDYIYSTLAEKTKEFAEPQINHLECINIYDIKYAITQIEEKISFLNNYIAKIKNVKQKNSNDQYYFQKKTEINKEEEISVNLSRLHNIKEISIDLSKLINKINS